MLYSMYFCSGYRLLSQIYSYPAVATMSRIILNINADTSSCSDIRKRSLHLKIQTQQTSKPLPYSESAISVSTLLEELELSSLHSFLGQDMSTVIVTLQRSGAKSVRDLIKSMNNTPYDALLQVSTCKTLASWARDEYYQTIIVSYGGLTSIINAMVIHRRNAAVQVQGCIVLGNLSAKSHNNKSKITALGGISVIQRAMENHTCSPFVQASATFAINKLTSENPCGRQKQKVDRMRNDFKEEMR